MEGGWRLEGQVERPKPSTSFNPALLQAFEGREVQATVWTREEGVLALDHATTAADGTESGQAVAAAMAAWHPDGNADDSTAALAAQPKAEMEKETVSAMAGLSMHQQQQQR